VNCPAQEVESDASRFCSADNIGANDRHGQSAPAGYAGSVVPPPAGCHGAPHGRRQNRNSADPDRNGGKAAPASDTARKERNEQFASRRRTSRSAVGIDRRSSTECANASMMAHTVNQSAVLRDDLQVISQAPEGLDIELAW